MNNRYLFGAILLALVFFLPSISGAQFFFDDWSEIVALPFLKSWESFWSALFSPSPDNRLSVRPLLYLSFALDWNISNGSPSYFRALNILIHLANGLLLGFFLDALIQKYQTNLGEEAQRSKYDQLLLAAVVGLFLFHPMYISTILEPARRSTLLSTFFLLTTLLLYLKGKNKISYLTFCCGLMVKEESIAVLGLLFFLSFYSLPLSPFNFKNIFYKLKYFFLITFLYIAYRWFHLENVFAQVGSLEWKAVEGTTYFFSQFEVTRRYFLEFFLPHVFGKTLVFYPFGVEELSSKGAIISGVAFWGVLILSASCLVYFRRNLLPLTLTILCCFIFLLAPTSIFPLMEVMATRRFYFAAPIIILAIFLFVKFLSSIQRPRFNYLLLGIFAFYLPSLGFLSWQQMTKYQTPKILWTEIIDELQRDGVPFPWRAALVYNNLGILEGKINQDRARHYFNQSLQCQKNYREGLINLFYLEMTSGNKEQARSFLQQALQDYPNDPYVMQANQFWVDRQ